MKLLEVIKVCSLQVTNYVDPVRNQKFVSLILRRLIAIGLVKECDHFVLYQFIWNKFMFGIPNGDRIRLGIV